MNTLDAATGKALDIIGKMFDVLRKPGETDDALRKRVQAESRYILKKTRLDGPHCTTCISPQLCTNDGRCYKMETNNFPRKAATPRSGDMPAVAAAIDAGKVPVAQFMPSGSVRALGAWELRGNPVVEEASLKALGLWVGAGRSERSYSFFDRVKPGADWVPVEAPYSVNAWNLPNNYRDSLLHGGTRGVLEQEFPVTMEPNADDTPGTVFVRYNLFGPDPESEIEKMRKAMVAKGWVTPEDAELARACLEIALRTNVEEDYATHCANALSILKA